MSNKLKRTLTVLCLCLAFILSACNAQNETVMQITKNGSTDNTSESVESESPVAEEVINAFCSENGSISVPLFLHTLASTKAEIMAQYESIEEYYGITIESVYGTPIEDTKEFWSITYSELEDGTAYTLGEYAFDRTVNACKQMLAIEGLSSAIDYKLPDEFAGKREQEYSSMIKEYGSADRWSVELAKDNLTIDDWDRVLHYYHTGSYLSEFMFEQNLLSVPTDEQAKESLENSRINFKFLNYYLYAVEETESKEETSENPEDTSKSAPEDSESTDEGENSIDATETSAEESSVSVESDTTVPAEEESSQTAVQDSETSETPEASAGSDSTKEEIDPEQANAEIIAYAKKVYNDLVGGSLSFDTALANSDDGELISAYYPDGMTMTHKDFVQYFGVEADELKVGDYYYYEDTKNNTVYIIQRVDFSETAISDEKENIKNELFSDYVVELSKNITVNTDVVSKYKNIWEF